MLDSNVTRTWLRCMGGPTWLPERKVVSCRSWLLHWPYIHTTSCSPDQRRKRSMLNFSNLLFISSLFCHLMFSVTRLHPGLSVGWSMGIEDPYIEEGFLKTASPNAIGCDVQPGPILDIRGSPRQQLSCNREKLLFLVLGPLPSSESQAVLLLDWRRRKQTVHVSVCSHLFWQPIDQQPFNTSSLGFDQ